MRSLLVFNPDRCLACRNCELACSVIHSRSGQLEKAIVDDMPPRRRITISAGREGIEALRCVQCLEPLCSFSCKSGALRRDPGSGRVIFDESRCVGCFMCLMVCPFGVRPDPATDRVVRCDVCRDLDSPACVTACPTQALAARMSPERQVPGNFAGHVVVVGSSAAGIAACEAAREHAPDCTITLVTGDIIPQYSRPLLSYVLAGHIGREKLQWRASDYLENDLKVRVLPACRAVELKPEKSSILLDHGGELEFDRLIVATGALGEMPAIRGIDLEGIYALRNLEDLDKIERLITPGGHAVVWGGGNVGLQACEALIGRGMTVTVVVKSPHLLSQMVDAEAGRRIGELFCSHGLNLRTGRDVEEFVGIGRVAGVRLDDGELINADLVVVGKGIRPNVSWLQGSGVRLGRGIRVDLCGRTNIPAIFAAGDCAEVIDPVTSRPMTSGIWPVAYEMGRAAGSTAVGVDLSTAGALRMNASRFFGVPIISIGEINPDNLEGGHAQILANRDGIYRKLIWCRGRLDGALLIGDISNAGIFYRLYREGVVVGDPMVSDFDEGNMASIIGPLIAPAEVTCTTIQSDASKRGQGSQCPG